MVCCENDVRGRTFVATASHSRARLFLGTIGRKNTLHVTVRWREGAVADVMYVGGVLLWMFAL